MEGYEHHGVEIVIKDDKPKAASTIQKSWRSSRRRRHERSKRHRSRGHSRHRRSSRDERGTSRDERKSSAPEPPAPPSAPPCVPENQGHPGHVAIPVSDPTPVPPPPAPVIVIESGGCGAGCVVLTVFLLLLLVAGGVLGFLWYKKLPPFDKKVKPAPGPAPGPITDTVEPVQTLTDEQKKLQALRVRFQKGKTPDVGPNERVRILRVIPPSPESGATTPSYKVQLKSKKIVTWTETELVEKVTTEDKRRVEEDKINLFHKFKVGDEVKLVQGQLSNAKEDYKPKTGKVVEIRNPKLYRLESDSHKGQQLFIYTPGFMGVFSGTLDDKDLFIDEAKLQSAEPAKQS